MLTLRFAYVVHRSLHIQRYCAAVMLGNIRAETVNLPSLYIRARKNSARAILFGLTTFGFHTSTQSRTDYKAN